MHEWQIGGTLGTAIAHLRQADRTSGSDPGVETPDTPPRLVLSAAPKEGSCGGMKIAPCDRIGMRAKHAYRWKPAATMPSRGMSVYHAYE
jgi:hypothetical protein